MLLNEGNEPFTTHTLLDIGDSNHKTCSNSKLDLLSPAAHGSVSQYIPVSIRPISLAASTAGVLPLFSRLA